MRVLVVESEPGLADEVIDAFVESGHTVTQCHDPGEPEFPCRALQDDRTCPLDEAPVHVAVALDGDRAIPGQPAAGHDGARCAIRRQIPLVVAGPKPSSLSPWATRACQSTNPAMVVDLAEDAAVAPLARHSAAAVQGMRSVLSLRGLDGEAATAEVTRTNDGLKVVLSPGVEGVDKRDLEIVSVRVLAAVRKVDPDAARISVIVTPETEALF